MYNIIIILHCFIHTYNFFLSTLSFPHPVSPEMLLNTNTIFRYKNTYHSVYALYLGGFHCIIVSHNQDNKQVNQGSGKPKICDNILFWEMSPTALGVISRLVHKQVSCFDL